MLLCLLFLLFVNSSKQEPLRRRGEPVLEKINISRRILNGKHTGNTRPYMVYLRQATSAGQTPTDPNWLCGGVIIHPRYILTSAACIQDVSHFYVIAGTRKWVPSTNQTNQCIINGAKKAVAKSVPKNYIYDGSEFNNILWMANDIAIVKVDEEFNFRRRILGCCYIPQMVDFNNRSEELEKPRTEGTIAGWGSADKFSELGISEAVNSPGLQESKLYIITKKNCKKLWPERYHYIIDAYMICARDKSVRKTACDPNDKGCQNTDPDYSYETQGETMRKLRRYLDDNDLLVRSPSRRASLNIGGFCENDHGGPLVVGRGKRSVVVGIITASIVDDYSQRCRGPFLFTSVWQNRHLINCVVNEETSGDACQNLFESRKIGVEKTDFDWSSIPSGLPREDFSVETEDSDESEGNSADVKKTGNETVVSHAVTTPPPIPT